MHAIGTLEHSPPPTQPLTLATLLLCHAGHPVTNFRDELSVHEFRISGFCQACQDDVFEPAVEVDHDVTMQLADSSDPSVCAVFSAALASAPTGEPTNHTDMMNRTDAAEWLQVDCAELTGVLCTALHWTSDHPGPSMPHTCVQCPDLLVGLTNVASDPSDSMGDGPQGVATANNDADSAMLPDLDLRTTTEIAEAEYACTGMHTPTPRTTTTRDSRGRPVGIRIDQMQDKLERLQSPTDIANLLSTAHAARLYAAEQTCHRSRSRSWQVRFDALDGLCDKAEAKLRDALPDGANVPHMQPLPSN